MNPFLYDTVASPLEPEAIKWRTCNKKSIKPAKKPWRKTIKAASLIAMTWASCAHAVDLNSASLNELQGVKGIGPKTAQIIIEERKRAGKYQSFSDLSDRVRGIGPKKAQALQASGLTISNTSKTAPKSK